MKWFNISLTKFQFALINFDLISTTLKQKDNGSYITLEGSTSSSMHEPTETGGENNENERADEGVILDDGIFDMPSKKPKN